MSIVPEAAAHHASVRALLLAAFPTGAEADLVDRLRADGDVAIARVALSGDDIVGHIVLSRMDAPFPALGLAPLAVRADRQGQAVGSRLIETALDEARAEGFDAVFVLGDPAYYGRFGFSAAAAEGFDSPYAGPFFMVVPLGRDALPVRTGRVAYAAAFADLA